MAAASGVEGGRPWENDGINYVVEVSKEQLAALQSILTESGGDEAEWSDEEDGGGRPLTPEDLWSEKHILDAAQLALNDHETKTGQKLNLEALVSGEYTIVSGDLYNLNLRVTDESGKPYLYETIVYTCPMYNRQGITGKTIPLQFLYVLRAHLEDMVIGRMEALFISCGFDLDHVHYVRDGVCHQEDYFN